MSASIVVNPTSGEGFDLTVTAGTSGLNLSTVTAASIKVNGSTTWAATIVSQSASQLVLRHAFVAGDAPTAGVKLSVVAFLTTPSGVRRTAARLVPVVRG